MKFKIGQKVKVKHDGEVGEVISLMANAEGVRYTISSKEWDFKNKTVLEGVKNCMEDELEAVK